MARILLDISSAYVRLALRVYFNLILSLLGIIGDQCCRKKAQLGLLQHRTIRTIHFTGWLRGSSAATAIWSTRRVPAGWLGLAMILAGLFWVAADLVVSALVVTVTVVDRCAFNTTGLYEVIRYPPFDNRIVPLNVGGLYDLVVQAQVTSQTNGGLEGIYSKVNDDPAFRADSQDVVGQWECANIEQDVGYPAYSNLTDVAADLDDRGIIFDATYSYCWDQYPGLNENNHLVIWSASVDDDVMESFEIRASIDMASTNKVEKIMRTFQCMMNASAVDWVLDVMQAGSSLNTWCPQLKGKMYASSLGVPPVADPGAVIASTLDAMVMIAGAYQSSPNGSLAIAGAYREPQTEAGPPVPDPTQGCLARKAQIPGPVILVFLIITGSTIGLANYWIYLTVTIKTMRRSNPVLVKLVEAATPNGLMGWMKQAVYETGAPQEKGYSRLKEWALLPSPDGQCLRLRRRGIQEDSSSGYYLHQVNVTPDAKSAGFIRDQHYAYVANDPDFPVRADIQASRQDYL